MNIEQTEVTFSKCDFPITGDFWIVVTIIWRHYIINSQSDYQNFLLYENRRRLESHLHLEKVTSVCFMFMSLGVSATLIFSVILSLRNLCPICHRYFTMARVSNSRRRGLLSTRSAWMKSLIWISLNIGYQTWILALAIHSSLS